MRSPNKPIAVDIGEWISYDANSGYLYWKKSTYKSSVPLGLLSGCVRSSGRPRVSFKRNSYLLSRIAYFLGTGIDPREWLVDHINGNIYDNRLNNLRLADHTQNRVNTRKTLRGIYPIGVRKTTTGRYRATIQSVAEGSRGLGTFDTPEEAHAAYLAAMEARGLDLFLPNREPIGTHNVQR